MDAFLGFSATALIAVGAFFVLIGSIGLVRLPGLYQRIHSVGMVDTSGAGLVLLGLGCVALQADRPLVAIKLLIILIFLAFTSPLAAHALAKTAWLSGHRPLHVDPADDQPLTPDSPEVVAHRAKGGGDA